MNDLAERFFIPLATYCVNRFRGLDHSLNRGDVAMEAVCHCWLKLDCFSPDRKNPMAYFTSVINRYVLHCNKRAAKHASRFLQDDLHDDD